MEDCGSTPEACILAAIEGAITLAAAERRKLRRLEMDAEVFIGFGWCHSPIVAGA
jgi:hypothetical protein